MPEDSSGAVSSNPEEGSDISETEKKRRDGVRRKGCLKLREDNKLVIYSNMVEELVNGGVF